MEAGDTSLTVVPTQKQPHSQGLVYKSRGKVQPTEVEQGSPGMGSGGSRQLASDRSDQLPGQRNRDDKQGVPRSRSSEDPSWSDWQ